MKVWAISLSSRKMELIPLGVRRGDGVLTFGTAAAARAYIRQKGKGKDWIPVRFLPDPTALYPRGQVWTHPKGKTLSEFSPMKVKKSEIADNLVHLQMDDGEWWFLDELREAGWRRK